MIRRKICGSKYPYLYPYYRSKRRQEIWNSFSFFRFCIHAVFSQTHEMCVLYVLTTHAHPATMAENLNGAQVRSFDIYSSHGRVLATRVGTSRNCSNIHRIVPYTLLHDFHWIATPLRNRGKHSPSVIPDISYRGSIF